MSTFLTAVRRFAQDERGITAIEYGLIAAVMAAAIVAAFNPLKTALSTVFNGIVTSLNNP